MMRQFFLLFIAACFIALPAAAQRDDEDPTIVKDSVYFTLDDGAMSRAEMELEAQYVHAQCMGHLYQSLYFDCACIAGAFLTEREKLGPMVLQDTIVTDLYRTGGQTAKCGNGPLIAGNIYEECMDSSRIFRRLETNNEEYCQCTGNRVARDFMDYPYLRTAYISRLRVNAMLACERQFPSIRENY